MQFIRANIASLLATMLDYIVTILLFRMLEFGVVPSSVIGSITGGMLHFGLSRNYVFQAAESRMDGQAVRYLIIWTGNILLNMLGVYFFAEVCNLHYLIAKIITTLLVFIWFNYPLHRRFVFKTLERK